MKSIKQLGIWMDHSVAELIEFSNKKVIKKTLKIAPAFLGPLENLRLNESLINNKEQNHLSDFYKKISDVIKNYDEVLLYGPTHAKTELFNQLKQDVHFDSIKIDIQSADKMTNNQQEAFVRKYFEVEI
ncbi:MAG TPA: hypothetical protein DER09_08375 [Prolixibacteraceae bacterium]|nr:hypothetical protein [Prolixibacteraceae bacterium]